MINRKRDCARFEFPKTLTIWNFPPEILEPNMCQHVATDRNRLEPVDRHTRTRRHSAHRRLIVASVLRQNLLLDDEIDRKLLHFPSRSDQREGRTRA